MKISSRAMLYLFAITMTIIDWRFNRRNG